MTSPRDLRALVRIAVEAEDAGIDGVMLSEHIVLGPSAGRSVVGLRIRVTTRRRATRTPTRRGPTRSC